MFKQIHHFFLLVGFLLFGCGGEPVMEATALEIIMPTTAPLITNGLTMKPVQAVVYPDSEATVSHLFSDLSGTETAINATLTAMPEPTRTPIPTPIPTLPTQTMSVIYFDGMASDWEIQSTGVFTTGYTGAAATGSASIIFTPTMGARVLFFTVKKSAERAYLHDDVLGITFQMTSPDGNIGKDDVAMTVIGSNRNRYWIPNDDSVRTVGEPNLPGRLRDDAISNAYSDIYPETSIQYLYVARAIPQGKWVPVNNYLPERVFAPDYKYVTGFYIKVDQYFEGRILIDDIRLIEWGE